MGTYEELIGFHKQKIEDLTQKYWDAQLLIDRYSREESEDRTVHPDDMRKT